MLCLGKKCIDHVATGQSTFTGTGPEPSRTERDGVGQAKEPGVAITILLLGIIEPGDVIQYLCGMVLSSKLVSDSFESYDHV